MDKESKQILHKIADSQLIMAEAVKNINHNTTTLAECNSKLTEVIAAHSTQTTEEHKGIKDTLERYWKLIVLMLGIIAALVGVKLIFPSL